MSGFAWQIPLEKEWPGWANQCWCRHNAERWIYPIDVPERAYQIEIIQTALLQNTLVCLPTGLGKTLIAAVVMHNFMRWFPEVQATCFYNMIWGSAHIFEVISWHTPSSSGPLSTPIGILSEEEGESQTLLCMFDLSQNAKANPSRTHIAYTNSRQWIRTMIESRS